MASKSMLLFVICVAMVLASCGDVPSTSTPTLPLSVLDNKPMSPSSWHTARVTCLDDWCENARLSCGAYIKMRFTGGTSPSTLKGQTGTIYVSVPSFYHTMQDDDSTYYFQKFVAEGKQ